LRVELSARAEADLAAMEATLSLPTDTRHRVRDSLQYLGLFPYMGRALAGRWEPLRVWGGPWRWMLFVYEVLGNEDVVLVVTIRDARSSSSPNCPSSRP
jgi:plasmid stabilization system protein ParE